MIDAFFLTYFATLNLGYLALLFSAAVDLVWVRRGLAGLPGSHLWLSGHVTLPVSVIAPAHNEEAGVVESVRSLLHLRYAEHQVIVVNDGSTDGTLNKLREAFDLVLVPLDYRAELPSKLIRGTYRSNHDARLLVIDKENGGKADALNAGVNASRYPLLCMIDADSILVPDALLRIVRVFVADPEVIAAGGSVRVANGCTIDMGHVLEVGLPGRLLVWLQAVEYLRAFFLGRLGWERLGGNLIVSGAFGVFRRNALVKAGGYRTDTVGEDMELVVRLRRMLPPELQRRAVRFLPDPVCFTEVPETLAVLQVQRDRWQRGLADTLWRHRSMLLRPRYGTIGMFVLPFFVVFELFGPVVELSGLLWFLGSVIAGTLDPVFAISFLIAAILTGFLLSLGGLLLEEQSFALYQRTEDALKLLFAAFIDGFGYRQITLIYRIRGLWSYLRGKRGWGTMGRLGFGSKRASTGWMGAPLAVLVVILAVVALPLGWLAKPELARRVAVLDKTVPFENYREHQWLLWLLSYNKAPTLRGGSIWSIERDYVGYDPVTETLELLGRHHLKDADLLFIADTYGVYSDDVRGRASGTAASERPVKIAGGLEASEMTAIEEFAARGGTVVAEFNTFASPTERSTRERLERVLGLTWSGWVGRVFSDLESDTEVPEWARTNFETQYGRPWVFEGAGLLFVRDDGHVVVLSRESDVEDPAVILDGSGAEEVPYGYWFDIVAPAPDRQVLAKFSIRTTPQGAATLALERLPSEFPALIASPDMKAVYLAGDFADGASSLGPAWLLGVPTVRRALARLGVLPVELEAFWSFYAPFIETMLSR